MLQRVKTLIRYTEATSAAGVCGVPADRAHFLDMPFYETGVIADCTHHYSSPDAINFNKLQSGTLKGFDVQAPSQRRT